MSAPSADSSRCAGRTLRPQRGAAMITALLTVALVAGIASAMVGNYGATSSRWPAGMTGRRPLARPRCGRLGPQRAGRTISAATPWTISARPGRWCRQRQSKGARSAASCETFQGASTSTTLVVGEDADGDAAAAIAAASNQWACRPVKRPPRPSTCSTGWIPIRPATHPAETSEARPVRPAHARFPNGQLAREDELVTQVPGFDAQLVARLKPFVAAPARSFQAQCQYRLGPKCCNAMLPDLPWMRHGSWVAERERAWFKDVADFNARLPEGVQGFDPRCRRCSQPPSSPPVARVSGLPWPAWRCCSIGSKDGPPLSGNGSYE